MYYQLVEIPQNLSIKNEQEVSRKTFDPQLVPQYGAVYNSMDSEHDSNKPIDKNHMVESQMDQNNIQKDKGIRTQTFSGTESSDSNDGLNIRSKKIKESEGNTPTSENNESDCFNLDKVVKNHYAETKFYLLLYAFLINFEVIVFITYWIYENDEAFNRYFLLFFYIPFLIFYTFPKFKKLALVAFLGVMVLKIKMCSSLHNDTFTMILFFSLLAETIVYFVLSIS